MNGGLQQKCVSFAEVNILQLPALSAKSSLARFREWSTREFGKGQIIDSRRAPGYVVRANGANEFQFNRRLFDERATDGPYVRFAFQELGSGNCEAALQRDYACLIFKNAELGRFSVLPAELKNLILKHGKSMDESAQVWLACALAFAFSKPSFRENMIDGGRAIVESRAFGSELARHNVILNLIIHSSVEDCFRMLDVPQITKEGEYSRSHAAQILERITHEGSDAQKLAVSERKDIPFWVRFDALNHVVITGENEISMQKRLSGLREEYKIRHSQKS